MEYLEFLFQSIPEYKKNMLIALLDDIGFTGFEEEPDQLKAYIDPTAFNTEKFDIIIQTVSVKYLLSPVKEINWNAKWESGFTPVTVLNPETKAPFAHIYASFHSSLPEAVHNIQITPKMSFGTGHHPTTYLMVEQLSRMDLKDESVIDFGTGTGVLSILSEKMGASSVVAIDNDEWSISNSAENIATNNCSKIQLIRADTIPGEIHGSIILANINLNIIISNLDAICKAASKEAAIIFSGILKQDESSIINAFKTHMLLVENVFYNDQWMLICAKK
ncbi:MAG: 50S ribosomal protein L11 methyltransferase [Ferruginibacter sp.]